MLKTSPVRLCPRRPTIEFGGRPLGLRARCGAAEQVSGPRARTTLMGSQSRPIRLGSARIILRSSTMPGMMEGKVAVVTGAGGGIGREIAMMMAAAGAKVIVADIGASLTGEGGSASPAEADQATDRAEGRRRRNLHRIRRRLGLRPEDHPGRARPFRPHRRRGEQRRHPARRDLPQDDRGRLAVGHRRAPERLASSSPAPPPNTTASRKAAPSCT